MVVVEGLLGVVVWTVFVVRNDAGPVVVVEVVVRSRVQLVKIVHNLVKRQVTPEHSAGSLLLEIARQEVNWMILQRPL